jgi:hypothetical protein
MTLSFIALTNIKLCCTTTIVIKWLVAVWAIRCFHFIYSPSLVVMSEVISLSLHLGKGLNVHQPPDPSRHRPRLTEFALRQDSFLLGDCSSKFRLLGLPSKRNAPTHVCPCSFNDRTDFIRFLFGQLFTVDHLQDHPGH